MDSQPTNTGNPTQPGSSRSSHALRGDYSAIQPDYSVEQPFEHYTDVEHDRWRRLYARQMELMPRYAAKEFVANIERLDVAGGIPDFPRINKMLGALTGFKIVAVPGLIPDERFFEHLANRRFPITWWIREESELDYLEEPDVFHDFFGHVPLLAHQPVQTVINERTHRTRASYDGDPHNYVVHVDTPRDLGRDVRDNCF